MRTKWAGRAEQKGAGEVITLLPFEILVAIFSHVDTVQDISNCRLVRSRWAEASLDSSLRYHSGWIRMKEAALFQEGKFKLQKEKTRFFNLAQGSAELFFTKAGISKPALHPGSFSKMTRLNLKTGYFGMSPRLVRDLLTTRPPTRRNQTQNRRQ